MDTVNKNKQTDGRQTLHQERRQRHRLARLDHLRQNVPERGTIGLKIKDQPPSVQRSVPRLPLLLQDLLNHRLVVVLVDDVREEGRLQVSHPRQATVAPLRRAQRALAERHEGA